jgi:(2Fe-2S) ferredoxin
MASFYDIHVFCCTHQRPQGHTRGCCSDKGSKVLCDKFCRLTMAMGLRRVRINHAGCMNLCEYGPTLVIYPEGTWYTYQDERDIREILDEHIRHGRRVERLLLDPAVISLRH